MSYNHVGYIRPPVLITHFHSYYWGFIYPYFSGNRESNILDERFFLVYNCLSIPIVIVVTTYQYQHTQLIDFI